jgi:xylulokinase
MDVYLGLDLGTTNLKALLVDKAGRVRYAKSHPLALKIPRPAWAEQDPADWIQAAETLLSDLPSRFKVRRLGLSGQMHSLVGLDAAGKVVRPAILWCDQRTTAQCRSATQALGGEAQAITLVGNPILEGFTLGKLLWLKDNEASHFKKIKSFLLPKDYLAYWLTGEKGTDYSDAAGTAAFDVAEGCWSRAVMEKLDLSPNLFPLVQESHATRGLVRKDLADRFGLAGVEVAAGGADNAASALGVGALAPGEVMVSVGTSGTVLAVTTARKPDPSGRLHFFSHAAPGSRSYMGVMLAAASALSFFTDKMGTKVDWAKLNPSLEQTPPGAGGMIFLPYLNGERTPHRDPDARGVLAGLSHQSGWPHILRAVMEGVSFGLRDSFELIKKLSEVRRIWLVGGGAKNPVWRRILAANFRQPVQTPAVDEGGAYGAAMLAALGDGMDLAAVSAWVKAQVIEEPDPSLVAFYDDWYPEFQNLYQDLQGRFKRLAK